MSDKELAQLMLDALAYRRGKERQAAGSGELGDLYKQYAKQIFSNRKELERTGLREAYKTLIGYMKKNPDIAGTAIRQACHVPKDFKDKEELVGWYTTPAGIEIPLTYVELARRLLKEQIDKAVLREILTKYIRGTGYANFGRPAECEWDYLNPMYGKK